MARISDEDLAAIRSKADIVEIIGHYLPVIRSGKSYKTECPFHDDHDPSLTISKDKQIFKCFVCGTGGGVFGFVQKYENVSFNEAVVKVAELVDYPLSISSNDFQKKVDPHLENLHKIMDETVRYSRYQMDTEEGAQAKQYCDRRGLNGSVRERFGIGYLPTNDQLYAFLKMKGYQDQDMVETNVVRTSASGIHDVFADRITFPIHDGNGRPIGFSARTMQKDNPSKYINTTETPLFHKGDIVYNLHRAKMSARRESKIYVCEGVTDVIAFSRAGIENCVCTLGTSCTEQQIRLLKSTAPKLVFCYDGDHAGQAATWRACKMAMKIGCQVSIVQNKTGLDPDDLLRDSGAEALQQMVSNEIVWLEFAIDYLKNQTNFNNYEERKEFARKAMVEVSEIQDDLDRQHFTNVISELSGFKLESTPVQRPVHRRRESYAAPVNTPLKGLQQAEEQIIGLMLRNPQAIKDFSDHLGYLTDQNRNAIAMMIVDTYRKKGTISADDVMDRISDPSAQDLLTRIMTSWYYELPYDAEMMRGAIRKIKISILEEESMQYRQQLTQPMNDQTRIKLLNEYQNCLRELRRYMDEENN